MSVIKSCLSFEGPLAYTVSWFHSDWCKFCIHLRTTKFCYFGMLVSTSPSMEWLLYWIS